MTVSRAQRSVLAIGALAFAWLIVDMPRVFIVEGGVLSAAGVHTNLAAVADLRTVLAYTIAFLSTIVLVFFACAPSTSRTAALERRVHDLERHSAEVTGTIARELSAVQEHLTDPTAR